MSRNKQTVKSATDKADDTKLQQNIFTNSFYQGITLGDYSSNDSTLQQHYAHYNSEAANVQSAIETLAATSTIPIGGIYTASTSANPNNPSLYQIDTITGTFTGGSTDVNVNSDIIAYMYGILFEIPAGSSVSDIKPIIQTALTETNLFQNVIVITDDSASDPSITVTVSHKGTNNKIPCFIENNNSENSQTFDNFKLNTSITQTAGQSVNLGYGTWTYLGYADTLLSEGSVNIHYFRRDS